VRKDFDYAFAENPYRGVPQIELHEFATEPFEVEGVEIVPIKGEHSRFEVTGFRFGKLAYLTDFKSISDAECAKLRGVEVLVVNALRFESHDSHFSVGEAMQLIEKVAPKKAYLTHMSHDVGLHCVANLRLNEGVEFAYDGLVVEL
jgi:phosphoribosyl 1,2-cyclic phosphate phosphodiesterase